MKSKTKIFFPRIEIASNRLELGPYVEEGSFCPPSNFIVSRNNSGDVVSYYSDDTWDFTAYHPKGRPHRLRFCSQWPEEENLHNKNKIVSEMKWIMFLLIWKRDGVALAVSTLERYLSCIRDLAKFALDNGSAIKCVFGCEDQLALFVNNENFKSSNFVSLVITLIDLGEKETGFKTVKTEFLSKLIDQKKLRRVNLQQTPPIPPRILSKIILQLFSALQEFKAVKIQWRQVFILCADDINMGRSRSRQTKEAKRRGETFSVSKMRPDFLTLVRKFPKLHSYILEEQHSLNVKSIATIALKAQLICKLIIHAFSGMRHSEVESLGYHCLECRKEFGKDAYLINGFTTKLTNGKNQPASWVTSKDAVLAIQTAQYIAKTIFGYLGVKPDSKKGQSLPLFPSLAYVSFSGRDMAVTSVVAHSYLALAHIDVSNKLSVEIEADDIKELESIDPHRQWSNESNFQVGKQWPLTTHQFRRSLALYASRSGLVSLPSLRRQLQHITEEMTSYYALGSTQATNIIDGAQDHFGTVYQAAQPESQAISYISNTLLSDEELFGGHGSWIKNNVKGDHSVQLIMNRQETLKQFRLGIRSYEETLYGGCTEILPCNKKAQRSLLACFECSKAVIKLSKLDRVIEAQKELVKQIDSNSMAWKAESEDLERLGKKRGQYE